MERPILASTAAKEITIINKVVSISAGVPIAVTMTPTVIRVMASRLSSAIKKCFRWEIRVRIAAVAIIAKMV